MSCFPYQHQPAVEKIRDNNGGNLCKLFVMSLQSLSQSLVLWFLSIFSFLCTPLLAHIICLPVNLFSLNPVSYLSSLNHNLTQYSPSLHTLTSILQIRSGSHSDALHIGHHKGTIGCLICLNRVTLCRHNGHSYEVQQISMRAQQT